MTKQSAKHKTGNTYQKNDKAGKSKRARVKAKAKEIAAEKKRRRQTKVLSGLPVRKLGKKAREYLADGFTPRWLGHDYD